MTDTERLIETEQRSKSNSHRLDTIESEIKEIKNDQKAIYSIATSVELIAQRVGHIDEKVDNANQKIDAQAEAWRETERKLSERVSEAENAPHKRVSNNWNSIKVAIITAVCTLIATGIVGALITFGAK